MGAWYTTRERVADALDIAVTALRAEQIDAAIEAASRSIDEDFRRRFTPELATKYLTWPPRDGGNPSHILRLGYNEVVSVSAVTAAGTAVTGWTLEPNDTGPPYARIEMPADGAGFTYGSTPQRNIAVTGLFGYTDNRETVGALSAELTAGATTLTLPTPALVGVGSTLIIEDERVTVTEKTYADTTADTTSTHTADMSDTGVTVDNATGFTVGEIILIDSERMRIDSISGTTLTVRRAADGSVLAAHTSGADVYAARSATITRAAHGTAAATHATSTTIQRWVPPAAIERLCVAEAIDTFEQERAGLARTIGTGDTQREAGGRGLDKLRSKAMKTHSRTKTRTRSV